MIENVYQDDPADLISLMSSKGYRRLEMIGKINYTEKDHDNYLFIKNYLQIPIK